jgi:hypothetical protein
MWDGILKSIIKNKRPVSRAWAGLTGEKPGARQCKKMKVIFKIGLAGVVMAAGCEFGEQGPDKFEGDGLPPAVELCAGCVADDQPLRGELMLLVNTKLTDSDSNFTINFPIDGEGRYVGNALYLYDPNRECEDGAAGCRLAKVGNLWLDDTMGPISVGDDSLRRFSVRDLAWHPDRGLWGLSYDPLNDEWGLTTLVVPDWHSSANRIETVRYAFKYGPVNEASTDECYWRQSVTGLGFVGDTLYAGSAGKPGNGLDARGAVFRIDPEFVAAPRHCVYAGDSTADPEYYACKPICSVWTSFAEKAGVAGDLVDARDGAMLAMARAEDASVLPAGQNVLFDVDVTTAEQAPVAAGPYIADIAAGLDVEGLARIGGVLYGINTAGTVYRIDEAASEADTWKVTVHDELGPLFTADDLSVRIRGATRVVVE